MGGSCSLAQGWLGCDVGTTQPCPSALAHPCSPWRLWQQPLPKGHVMALEGNLLVRTLERCPENWGGLCAAQDWHSEEGGKALGKQRGFTGQGDDGWEYR